MKVTYTLVLFHPDSRGASSGWFPFALLFYFKTKYGRGRGGTNPNTQTSLGFLGVTETKLSHLTVKREYGGEGGLGGGACPQLPLAALCQ